MNIAVIGLNHNNAPIEIREKVSFTDTKKIEGTNILLDKGIKEVVIISTCNRSEIYIIDKEDKIDDSIDFIKNFYKDFFKINNIKEYLFTIKGRDAIYHLYEVSSGLKSIVLGEDQILGQVKEAHNFAMDLGSSKKILNKIFREAVTTAKNIKSKIKISEHPLSISYIGVKYLKDKLGSLKGKNALIIGLGKMGKLALKHLLEEDLDNIYMSNRNHDKTVNLKKDYPDIIPIDYYDRYSIIEKVDILITATASPHRIIEKNKMSNRDKPLYIMDMALPRDVDKEVGELDNIFLYDIDNLKDISTENEKKREQLSLKAKGMIKDNIDDLLLWLKTVKADPIIKDLNERCKEIEQDTLNIIYRKLDLDCREKKIISKMLNSALKRLIREPIVKLKGTADDEERENYIDVLEKLFIK
ncbi:glutamyl-tRNA reductase [Dethiothermospora halolimnae]|uniref:glutamyl-tRNA reductase n=1 Tax=Dethiothermospora halolimnae TaxID=3114390 RepID=UPI003CCC0C69